MDEVASTLIEISQIYNRSSQELVNLESSHNFFSTINHLIQNV